MTTKTDITLKPCPFCGGPARFSRNDELVNVRCDGWNPGECLGAGPNCYTEVEAAAGWNRRAAVESDRQRQSAVISDIWRVLHDAGAPDCVFDMPLADAVRAMIGQPAASAEPDDMPLLDDRATYPASQVRRLIREDRARRAAPVAQEPVGDAATTLAAICDLFGIGSAARDPGTILTNVENVVRRSECLRAVERHLTVSTPPDPDEGDDEAGEECLLRWGADPEGYAEHFTAALAQFQAAQPSAQDREDAERMRNAAAILDTLTSNLDAKHPLRAEATEGAKRAVADLYQIADQIDAAPAAKGADHA